MQEVAAPAHCSAWSSAPLLAYPPSPQSHSTSSDWEGAKALAATVEHLLAVEIVRSSLGDAEQAPRTS